LTKKKDPVEIGIDYVQRRANDYSTQELKQLLNNRKNDCIQTFLQDLSPTKSTDYSLWKATRKLKQATRPSPPLRTPQGAWARSNVEKAHAFAEHLVKVFQPHPSENTPKEEDVHIQLLEIPYQLEPPINCLKRAEVQKVINNLNPKNHQAMILLPAKPLKSCLPPESNILPSYSMLLCSKVLPGTM
jgi:hypothetical protein